MPTPRYHGGAPLAHIPLNLPAFKGLNKQGEFGVLDVSWATRLDNAVIDEANRVAARKGYTSQTTTAPAVDFLQLFEWDNAGTYELFASSATAIYRSTDDGDTWTDVTGTLTMSDGNGMFNEFNGKVIYTQAGQPPGVYTGTTFAPVVDGAAPTGAVCLSAWGRLWCVDADGWDIKYCALLNEADWSGTDAGGINVQNVWPSDDQVTALEAFNGSLVVFGSDNILVWTDGQGSALGVTPTQLYVADTLGGIGCIARDSVVNVDGDLWFLSRKGVVNFGRLIQERSNPLNNLSKNVQDFLRDYVSITDTSEIRAVYSQQERFYLLSLPAGAASESGVAFAFDTRGNLEDGSVRVSGVWTGLVPRAIVQRIEDLSLVFTLIEKQGELLRYEGRSDDGDAYPFNYESGYTELGNSYLKIAKRLEALLLTQVEQAVTFKWAFDFTENFRTATVIYPASSGLAEYGIMEFSEAEWNGVGIALQEKKVGGRGTGEYIKVGLSTQVDGGQLGIQQVNLYTKTGRLR